MQRILALLAFSVAVAASASPVCSEVLARETLASRAAALAKVAPAADWSTHVDHVARRALQRLEERYSPRDQRELTRFLASARVADASDRKFSDYQLADANYALQWPFLRFARQLQNHPLGRVLLLHHSARFLGSRGFRALGGHLRPGFLEQQLRAAFTAEYPLVHELTDERFQEALLKLWPSEVSPGSREALQAVQLAGELEDDTFLFRVGDEAAAILASRPELQLPYDQLVNTFLTTALLRRSELARQAGSAHAYAERMMQETSEARAIQLYRRNARGNWVRLGVKTVVYGAVGAAVAWLAHLFL